MFAITDILQTMKTDRETIKVLNDKKEKVNSGHKEAAMRRYVKIHAFSHPVIMLCIVLCITGFLVVLMQGCGNLLLPDNAADSQIIDMQSDDTIPYAGLSYISDSLIAQSIVGSTDGASRENKSKTQNTYTVPSANRNADVRFLRLEDAVIPDLNEHFGEHEDPLPYLIYVSKNSHTIAILGLDENGEYTEIINIYPTATGRTSAMTRTGIFRITTRERWHSWGGSTYSPYTTRYDGGAFFHGPVYTARNSYSLKVSSYNAIGTNATSGCMRTTTEAALWIYENCETGTIVVIANDSVYTAPAPAPLDDRQRSDPTDPYA